MSDSLTLDPGALNFEKGNGLVTVITQDARTGTVLMVAHADREALERTIETAEMHYHSRTRGLWHKGATSGNVQHVVSLTPDCDGDAVLARVHPAGPACHTGEVSCFGEVARAADALAALDRTLAERAAMLPALAATKASYTQRLLTDRNLRLKKLGEEVAELIAACADGDRERAMQEGVDVLYHALVALRALGITLDDLRSIVEDRAR